MKTDRTSLLKQAQDLISKHPAAIENIPATDIKQLVEDLQVHQIELEIQNEELRRLQQDLEKARDKYSDLYDFSPVSYFAINEKGIILEANLTAAVVIGVEREFLKGRPFTDFIARDDQDVFYRHRRTLCETMTGQTCELRIRGGQGSEFYALLESIVVQAGSKKGNLIRTVVTDIHARKRAEDALRESEEKYRLLVENANDAIFIVQKGRIKFANQKAKQLGNDLGVDLDRVPFEQYIHPDDRPMVLDRHERRIKGEKPPTGYGFRLVGHEDQELWVVLNAVQINWQGKPATLNFLKDITLERKLEKQLQLSQKMEAVGTLAGGIAHDFNNLLMGIQGRTSLMLLETDPSQPQFEHLKEIENIILRATRLTKQLLGFARGGKYEVKPTDMNDLIEKSSQMFGRTKKEITIYEKYQDQIWTVEIDRSQIDQVLLNVFVNAWQAMPAGGNLYLQTENEILDENFAGVHGVRPGKYVVISITDTGIGMEEKTLKRIFDPFFTTKEKERGTGLGLASAYGIIKNHDGILMAESARGQGATFRIYLPASEKPAIEELRVDQNILTGSETILLVDDEEMILDVGAQILEKLGYEVFTARHGREAIEVYQQNKQKVAMVILDLIMPKMGGGETFDRLKEMDPNVKVLLSSGYSLGGQATEILKRGCDGFIQKPFNMKDLSEKLRQIILK
jgi:PAS domain S-box-containing protein